MDRTIDVARLVLETYRMVQEIHTRMESMETTVWFIGEAVGIDDVEFRLVPENKS